MKSRIIIDPRTLIVWTTNTNYKISITPGLVREVGNNKTYSPGVSSQLDFTSFLSGPYVTGTNYIGVTSTNFLSTVTLNYNRTLRTVPQGTANYNLYNTSTGLVSSIDGRGPGVTFDGTQTVIININDSILPEGEYYIVSEAGIFTDNFNFPNIAETIGTLGIGSSSVTTFYQTSISNMVDRQYDGGNTNTLFVNLTPQIVDNDLNVNKVYTLTLDSPIGDFSSPIGSMIGGVFVTSTTKAAINAAFKDIKFTPTSGEGNPNSTYSYTLSKDSVELVARTLNLYGVPFTLDAHLVLSTSDITRHWYQDVPLTATFNTATNVSGIGYTNFNILTKNGNAVNTTATTATVVANVSNAPRVNLGSTGTFVLRAAWTGRTSGNVAPYYYGTLSNTLSLIASERGDYPGQIILSHRPSSHQLELDRINVTGSINTTTTGEITLEFYTQTETVTTVTTSATTGGEVITNQSVTVAALFTGEFDPNYPFDGELSSDFNPPINSTFKFASTNTVYTIYDVVPNTFSRPRVFNYVWYITPDDTYINDLSGYNFVDFVETTSATVYTTTTTITTETNLIATTTTSFDGNDTYSIDISNLGLPQSYLIKAKWSGQEYVPTQYYPYWDKDSSPSNQSIIYNSLNQTLSTSSITIADSVTIKAVANTSTAIAGVIRFETTAGTLLSDITTVNNSASHVMIPGTFSSGTYQFSSVWLNTNPVVQNTNTVSLTVNERAPYPGTITISRTTPFVYQLSTSTQIDVFGSYNTATTGTFQLVEIVGTQTTVINTGSFRGGSTSAVQFVPDSVATLSTNSHNIKVIWAGQTWVPGQFYPFYGTSSNTISQGVRYAVMTETANTLTNTIRLPNTFYISVDDQGDSVRTGTVSFYEGSTLLGTTATSGSNASLTLPAYGLSTGTHAVHAIWNNVTPVVKSNTVTTQILAVGNSTITSSSIPTWYAHNLDGTLNTTATLTATVVGPYAAHAPGGIVDIYDTGVKLGSGGVTRGGVTFNWNPDTYGQIDNGTRTLNVEYTGDPWYYGSTTTNTLLAKRRRSFDLTETSNTSSYVRPINVTLTATGNGNAVYLNGKTVSFYADNTLIGTSTFNSSTKATITFDSTLTSTGTVQFKAIYNQDFGYTTATSNLVSASMNKGNIPFTISMSSSTYTRPESVVYRITTPSTYNENKTVALYDNGSLLTTVSYTGTNTTFTIGSNSLSTGTQQAYVSYNGDLNYNNQTSNTITFTSDKIKLAQNQMSLSIPSNSNNTLTAATISMNVNYINTGLVTLSLTDYTPLQIDTDVTGIYISNTQIGDYNYITYHTNSGFVIPSNSLYDLTRISNYGLKFNLYQNGSKIHGNSYFEIKQINNKFILVEYETTQVTYWNDGYSTSTSIVEYQNQVLVNNTATTTYTISNTSSGTYTYVYGNQNSVQGSIYQTPITMKLIIERDGFTFATTSSVSTGVKGTGYVNTSTGVLDITPLYYKSGNYQFTASVPENFISYAFSSSTSMVKTVTKDIIPNIYDFQINDGFDYTGDVPPGSNPPELTFKIGPAGEFTSETVKLTLWSRVTSAVTTGVTTSTNTSTGLIDIHINEGGVSIWGNIAPPYVANPGGLQPGINYAGDPNYIIQAYTATTFTKGLQLYQADLPIDTDGQISLNFSQGGTENNQIISGIRSPFDYYEVKADKGIGRDAGIYGALPVGYTGYPGNGLLGPLPQYWGEGMFFKIEYSNPNEKFNKGIVVEGYIAGKIETLNRGQGIENIDEYWNISAREIGNGTAVPYGGPFVVITSTTYT